MSLPWNNSAPPHRWMLVAPVLGLMIFLTLREGHLRMTAQLAQQDSWVQATVHADTGAEVASSDDGTVLLSHGGVFLQSEGIGTVRAGEWDVSVWGGATYVTLMQSSLTVAAFDVPVLVRGRLGIVVVPPLQQWNASSGALPDPSIDPAAWMQAVQTKPLPASFLRARRPIIDATDHAATLQGDAVALAEADTATLAAIALQIKPTREIAAAVRSRAELRSYALLQPRIRDVSWTFLPNESVIDADAWIALLMLPRVQQGDAPVSPLTVRRWGEALQTAFDQSFDPDGVCSAVLPIVEATIARMVEDGYPLRALRFAEALRHAVGTERALTVKAAAAFERLRAMTPESLKAAVLSERAVQSQVSIPKQSMTPHVPMAADPTLEQRARAILIARGGMFTSDSTVRTIAPGAVEVIDVVFGFPSGDRALRFHYLVEDDTVRATINGQIQPYAVPYEAYMEWIGGL